MDMIERSTTDCGNIRRIHSPRWGWTGLWDFPLVQSLVSLTSAIWPLSG